jgi:hypothetical protein
MNRQDVNAILLRNAKRGDHNAAVLLASRTKVHEEVAGGLTACGGMHYSDTDDAAADALAHDREADEALRREDMSTAEVFDPRDAE